MEIVYLDNAATTQINAAVLEEMAKVEQQHFYNSSALYSPSLVVKNEITRANEIVKRRLAGSGGGDLIFTSGATESNNMVIFGKIKRKDNHLLVLAGEHSSVYAPAKYLKDNGFDVDFIPLESDGAIDLEALARLVRTNTTLVVFGMVNSDTGCKQDADAIVRTVRSRNLNTHIHCDATQAFCKFNFDAGRIGLDSCAVSAHKINGPKGVGALWIRKNVVLRSIMYGGGQQPLRPGTENNAGVIGFGKAVEVFRTDENFSHVSMLHKRLINGLPQSCKINGSNNNPYITNIQLPNSVLGQTVLNALSGVGICVGVGSACASTASKNRTLLAMGISEAKTKQVLRVSFGVFNTLPEVDKFLAELEKVLLQLQ